MPWDGTILYLADLDEDGAVIGEPQRSRAARRNRSSSPSGRPTAPRFIFVSDRTGWWNLYRYELATRASSPIAPMAAEFGQPQWAFGMSTYAFAGPDRIVCTCSQAGLGKLALIDLATGTLQTLETPFTQFASVRADGDRSCSLPGRRLLPTCVVALDLKSGQHRILEEGDRHSRRRPDLRIAAYLTSVEAVEFPTKGGKTAFGLFYPPHNPDYAGPADEKPPLLVKCHGGPTSAASSSLSLGTHYWTSRGIAVLDVNYGGSTGFGRAYRDRLERNWGIVDVDDCINGARFLASEGWSTASAWSSAAAAPADTRRSPP